MSYTVIVTVIDDDTGKTLYDETATVDAPEIELRSMAEDVEALIADLGDGQ